MKWSFFIYEGQTYDLSHVHPFEWVYVLPAKGDKPERHYPFCIEFSMHTFTRGIKAGEAFDRALIYQDSREKRIFDFGRYELSKQLPDIVQTLGKRKCHHTHHGNFFTVELTGESKQNRSYEVYFAVSRSGSRGGGLNLYVQSAYLRDSGHGSRPTRKPSIRFHVIAHNTLHKKPIKAPK